MTDPYITVLMAAKVKARTDAREIKRLRMELGECRSLVGRYRMYFAEHFPVSRKGKGKRVKSG